jgi:hypothetical protein
MRIAERGTLIVAVILITLGLIFLLLNLVPGWNAAISWPIIFFVLSIGFFLPAFMWPSMRNGLAALFIPGSVLAMLGLIFIYDVLTADWNSWAFSWLLIIAAVGFGLAIASSTGKWGRTVTLVGSWIMTISTFFFVIFAVIFGGEVLKMIAPFFFILIGIYLIFRSTSRKK